jgi:hypothetical protein
VGGNLVAKRQVTGLDVLMLKDPAPEGSTLDRVKWAGIADAFGFSDYALEILASDRSTEADEMRAAVLRGAAPVPARASRRGPLGRRTGVAEENPFASLHG